MNGATDPAQHDPDAPLLPERIEDTPPVPIVRVAARDPGEGRLIRDVTDKLVATEKRLRHDDYFVREALAWLKNLLARFLRAGVRGGVGAIELKASEAEEHFENAEAKRAERLHAQVLLKPEEIAKYAEAAGKQADAIEKLEKLGLAYEIDENGRLLVVRTRSEDRPRKSQRAAEELELAWKSIQELRLLAAETEGRSTDDPSPQT